MSDYMRVMEPVELSNLSESFIEALDNGAPPNLLLQDFRERLTGGLSHISKNNKNAFPALENAHCLLSEIEAGLSESDIKTKERHLMKACFLALSFASSALYAPPSISYDRISYAEFNPFEGRYPEVEDNGGRYGAGFLVEVIKRGRNILKEKAPAYKSPLSGWRKDLIGYIKKEGVTDYQIDTKEFFKRALESGNIRPPAKERFNNAELSAIYAISSAFFALEMLQSAEFKGCLPGGDLLFKWASKAGYFIDNAIISDNKSQQGLKRHKWKKPLEAYIKWRLKDIGNRSNPDFARLIEEDVVAYREKNNLGRWPSEEAKSKWIYEAVLEASKSR